jgi:ribosomal protein L44E
MSEFKELKRCPTCKKNTLYQVYSVHSVIKSEPKTLIQQAERNTKKLGKYELEEKRRRDKLLTEVQRKAPLIKKGLLPPDAIGKEKPKTWYGEIDEKKKKELFTGNDSKKKIKKYIKEGK